MSYSNKILIAENEKIDNLDINNNGTTIIDIEDKKENTEATTEATTEDKKENIVTVKDITEATTEANTELIEVLDKINSNSEVSIFCFSLMVGLLIALCFSIGFNSNSK